MAQFVFRFVSGSFFPQLRVFNNFSASLSGSFSAIHVAFLCIFNNFSGSFFKKGILFCFLSPEPVKNSRLLYREISCCARLRRGKKYSLRPAGSHSSPASGQQIKTTILAHKSQAHSAFFRLRTETFLTAEGNNHNLD